MPITPDFGRFQFPQDVDTEEVGAGPWTKDMQPGSRTPEYLPDEQGIAGPRKDDPRSPYYRMERGNPYPQGYWNRAEIDPMDSLIHTVSTTLPGVPPRPYPMDGRFKALNPPIPGSIDEIDMWDRVGGSQRLDDIPDAWERYQDDMRIPGEDGFPHPGTTVQQQDTTEESKTPTSGRDSLKLNDQEEALYQRHLSNLYGKGGVDNADKSRSSLKITTAEIDGRYYVIPTVRDGKILDSREAIAAAIDEGLDKFPAYASQEEAAARYDQMHQFMEKDTQKYQENTADLGGSVGALGEMEKPETKTDPMRGTESASSLGLFLSQDSAGGVGKGLAPQLLEAFAEDVSRFTQTGDPKAAFRIATMVAGGGFARGAVSAEAKGTLGMAGGKPPTGPIKGVIEGGAENTGIVRIPDKLKYDVEIATKSEDLLPIGTVMDELDKLLPKLNPLSQDAKDAAALYKRLADREEHLYGIGKSYEVKEIHQLMADRGITPDTLLWHAMEALRNRIDDARETLVANPNMTYQRKYSLNKEIRDAQKRLDDHLTYAERDLGYKETLQINPTKYEETALNASWDELGKKIGVSANDARLQVFEGGKEIHDTIKAILKDAKDQLVKSSRANTDHPELIRQKTVYYEAIKEAESWYKSIEHIARTTKEIPEAGTAIIMDMQKRIDRVMEKASNAKKLIDNWPAPEVQQQLPGIKSPPANMAQQQYKTGDTISKDPNQLELNFQHGHRTIEERAPIHYREMRAAIPKHPETGEKDMGLFNKTIEAVAGSRKEWKDLSKEERQKIYNTVITHDYNPGRKDLSAARTPEDLIHFKESNRPSYPGNDLESALNFNRHAEEAVAAKQADIVAVENAMKSFPEGYMAHPDSVKILKDLKDELGKMQELHQTFYKQSKKRHGKDFTDEIKRRSEASDLGAARTPPELIHYRQAGELRTGSGREGVGAVYWDQIRSKASPDLLSQLKETAVQAHEAGQGYSTIRDTILKEHNIKASDSTVRQWVLEGKKK